LCLWLTIGLATATLAQNFPVQASLFIGGPYSLSLEDYYAPNDTRLKLMIWLKDVRMSQYPVRLRFTIESNRVRITTRPDYRPAPIYLQGGMTQTFFGYDLMNYFDIDNLNFSGIDRSQYARQRILPEGLYRFSVEVLDYYRGTVVSNMAMFQAYIVLNDPPVINYPLNGSKIPFTGLQHIVFNWAPRHMGSPNSAFSTVYRLRIVEVIPDDRNPYEAMMIMPPVFETTTSLTTFIYDGTCPLLVPGRKYAFNVTAIDQGGRDLFKNGGASETFTFTYVDKI
jgi:hypothetical protein